MKNPKHGKQLYDAINIGLPVAVGVYNPIEAIKANSVNWNNFNLPAGNYTAEHIVGEFYNSQSKRYEYIETDSMISNTGTNVYVISSTGLYSNRPNISNGGFIDYD
ncbi:MAG: hypothetical protein IKS17_08265 [Firmicutes bacterium]|nr:hypothetical protein [Bacillota bacterium]